MHPDELADLAVRHPVSGQQNDPRPLRDARLDVLPELHSPCAEIQTEALGLSAVEVEQLITVPIEADLLNGVEGVGINRSESLPSKSSTV